MKKTQSHQDKNWIGIDVSKTDLEIHSLSSAIKIPAVVSNSLQGFRQIEDAISNFTSIHLIFESTGGYEKALFNHFSELGIDCSRLNPSHSRSFARAKGLLAKTDKIDAMVLSEFGEKFNPPTTIKKSTVSDDMQEMVHYKNHLINARHREKMQLEHQKPVVIQKMIKARIKTLDNQIQKTEMMLSECAHGDSDLSAIVKILEQTVGVGERSAIAIITALPELGTLNNKEITALAGLAPFNRDSGTMRGKRSVSGGRKSARNALYMSAMVGSRRNAVLKEFFQRLKENGKPYKVAITATMRKLLTYLNSLIKNHLKEKDLILD
jgi:transposase